MTPIVGKTYPAGDLGMVRVLCTDAAGLWPVIGLRLENGLVEHFSPGGKHASGCAHLDLREPPPEPVVEWWVVSCLGIIAKHTTKDDAQNVLVGEIKKNGPYHIEKVTRERLP